MKKLISITVALLLVCTGCTSRPNNSLKTIEQGNTTTVKEPTSKLKRFDSSFLFLFDTVTFVVGYAEDKATFAATTEKLHDELEEYHQLYDIYNEYPGVPNLYTINKNAGIAPVKVDPRIIDLLELGIEIYEESDGLTNIAMGSVLNIWHDYRTQGIDDPNNAKVPPLEKLKEASKHTDITKMIIDREASTVYLEDPLMSLDVGSIGKGYAVEKVAESLESQGYDHLLLSVGGNIRAIGAKPDGSFWDMGIENPYGEEDYIGIVQMDHGSLVTSGSYQRYYTVDGVSYHHIIHPETLMPEHNMAAVAILCDDSGLADAYSTAIFNMTVEEGQKWVEQQPDIEAMWMLEDKTVIYSSGFEKHLKK